MFHVQLKEPLTWFSWSPQCDCKENGKKLTSVAKNLAIQGTVFVVVRISNYCSAKCKEIPSLVASTGIRHHISLVSFSSCSVFRYKRKKHVEVCPCSPSTVDQSTAVDLIYYS